MVTRKYNQRTKSWDSKVLKKSKDYAYVTLMVARVLNARLVDSRKVTRKIPLGDDDPRRISSTIAAVPPEESTEIHKRKVSRFPAE